MAKFEEQGYCPANALQRRAMQSGNPTAINELGARIQFMVYPFGYIPEGEASVLSLMETPTGMEVAEALRKLIPECEYPEVGRKIELRDIPADKDWEEGELAELLNIAFSDIILKGDGFDVAIQDKGEKVIMRIMA